MSDTPTKPDVLSILLAGENPQVCMRPTGYAGTYNAAARALRDLDLTVDLHPFAAMTPPRPALRPSRYPRQPIQRNQ